MNSRSALSERIAIEPRHLTALNQLSGISLLEAANMVWEAALSLASTPAGRQQQQECESIVAVGCQIRPLRDWILVEAVDHPDVTNNVAWVLGCLAVKSSGQLTPRIAGAAAMENATFAEGKRHTRRPKNGEGRVVPIDNRTVSVLRSHKARQAKERLEAGGRWLDKDLVFRGGLGWPLPPDTPYKRMVKAMAQAKLPRIRLHDLRHLHSTWLLEDGEPLHVVANRLGHRDPMVTALIYAHATMKQSIRAAETCAARIGPQSLPQNAAR